MRLETAAPQLERQDGEPLFAEPWQAQALAIADSLVVAGRFTSAEWSETLGAEVRSAAGDGEPDTQGTYYAAALRALERLTLAKGLVDDRDLADRKSAWVKAYQETPHGQPVTLPQEA